MELNEVKKILETLSQDYIEFDAHFYKRSGERPVSEGMVRKFLLSTEKLEVIEYGKEGSNRFKLWYKMSNRYSLVVIVWVATPKGLKVISAWNTDRKWQDKLKQ